MLPGLRYIGHVKTTSPGLINEVTRRLAAGFQPEEVCLLDSHAWREPLDNEIEAP